MKYEKIERMLRQDFEVAKVNHDFSEMADDYELLRELWATGELDSEEYHDVLAPMLHCFVEVKKDKIELPSMYKRCKQNFLHLRKKTRLPRGSLVFSLKMFRFSGTRRTSRRTAA